MGLYDALKDVAKVLQKADNIDLYSKLIDLSAQALELQNQIAELTKENSILKKEKEIDDDIERHYELLFMTRKSEQSEIKYCTHCWDSERKLIQVQIYGSGRFQCPHCKTAEVYDKQKNSDYYKNHFSVGVIPRNRHSY
jgi:transcription elongation factor Elf1